ncbi:MAG: VanW family protein [bacterium]|nr:VanW family protein [bacterium]
MIAESEDKHIFFVRFVLLVVIVLFLASIGLLNYISTQEESLADRLYPNVYVDNVSVGRKTKKEITDFYKKKGDMLKNFNLKVVYENIPIATFSASKLRVHSDGEEVTDRAYLVGRSSHMSSRFYQKISALFNFASYTFETRIVYDKTSLNDFISDTEDNYNKPAKNALFSFENSKVVSFREDKKGIKINSTKFMEDVDKTIMENNKKVADRTVVLTHSLVDPEITLKNSNIYGIEELIGEGVSNFSHSIPERIHNITIAASKFNGVLIPKDKVFSFDDTIGDISSLSGYKPAYIIKNGRTVLGDGGGVCQVSTTLFRAALNTGIPIVERHAHAYRVLYYENDSKPGFDATIFTPTIDLKIKNDTRGHILIQTQIDAENNLLYFRFYGKKDGRRVELTTPVLYDQSPPPEPLYQDDPTMKKGVVKQIDYPAWGGKSKFSYKVIRGSETIFGEDFLSVYRPWQAVYLVGTAD